MVLLMFILSCFLGRSCGFQVPPTSFRKRKHRHTLPHHDVYSARSSFVPLTAQESKDTMCLSSTALQGTKSYGHVFDWDVSKELRSTLVQYTGTDSVRLYASSNDDKDQSPSPGKIRSFISKIFKRISSPVVSSSLPDDAWGQANRSRCFVACRFRFHRRESFNGFATSSKRRTAF